MEYGLFYYILFMMLILAMVDVQARQWQKKQHFLFSTVQSSQNDSADNFQTGVNVSVMYKMSQGR